MERRDRHRGDLARKTARVSAHVAEAAAAVYAADPLRPRCLEQLLNEPLPTIPDFERLRRNTKLLADCATSPSHQHVPLDRKFISKLVRLQTDVEELKQAFQNLAAGAMVEIQVV